MKIKSINNNFRINNCTLCDRHDEDVRLIRD